ncbi:MAG: glycosyltransferase family 4 protein [Candidatus Azobacteroides sp.]|nr:glycosyltransferase family 4 protein [Candidatus Azobacteroides sp.]
MKVLFLSIWYPHRYNAMSGLFVRKHAEAVSRYAEICVLHLRSDENIKQFEIVGQNFEKVKEIYVYFPFIHNKLFLKISKAINYIRAFAIGYKIVKSTFGKPDITHVNVLTRSGVLAYWMKKTQKIPYVIIEHWTRYLPQNFSYTGFLRKKITEIVAKNAGKIMPVSEDLARAMQKQGIKGDYEVVYNVVDDFFFEEPVNVERNKNKKRILHVSCFVDNQKNITGLLRAVKELSLQRADFELVLIGIGVDFEEIYNYAKSLNLPENMLIFTGEQTPREVAEWFAKSDFFVMFSNYENAPVVISESLAMGKPVISSDVGGIREMINKESGILLPMKNEKNLTESVNFMLDNLEKYDFEKIKKEAKKYSYENIGKKLFDTYLKSVEK